MAPRLTPQSRPAHKKEARLAQEGGLKSGRTMPKSPPPRNAGVGINDRFSAGFSDSNGRFFRKS
jgi:hypothetical protein